MRCRQLLGGRIGDVVFALCCGQLCAVDGRYLVPAMSSRNLFIDGRLGMHALCGRHLFCRGRSSDLFCMCFGCVLCGKCNELHYVGDL